MTRMRSYLVPAPMNSTPKPIRIITKQPHLLFPGGGGALWAALFS